MFYSGSRGSKVMPFVPRVESAARRLSASGPGDRLSWGIPEIRAFIGLFIL
jgi:hypothetical protein